jgi:hypothetical protein
MSVKVCVQGLLGSLEDQMAIGTTVNVAGNNGGDTRRETTFEVFTDQADGLSARHGSPQILFPAEFMSTNRSNREMCTRFHDYPTKSTIYGKVMGS